MMLNILKESFVIVDTRITHEKTNNSNSNLVA